MAADDRPQRSERRRGIIRTALVLAAIALGLYVTFILIQVL